MDQFPKYFRILDWMVAVQISEKHGVSVSHTSDPYIMHERVESLLYVPGKGVPVEILAHEFYKLYAETQATLAAMVGIEVFALDQNPES